MTQPFIEPGLFDPPPSAPTVKAPTAADTARALRPVWTRHTGNRQPCQQCVRDLHGQGGVGPMPRDARLVRTVRATGDRAELCEDHARPLREADAQAAGRSRSGARSKAARR